MGTYLYLAKIDTKTRERKQRDMQNLVCFSDDELWRGIFYTIKNFSKCHYF